MEVNTLQGACSCGRNRYIVQVPSNTSTSSAHVYFDNSSSSRRQLASPFTAWLHIPVSWYTSATLAFFPDETHRSIRRSFITPHQDKDVHQQFCGYCGTQLSRYEMRLSGAESGGGGGKAEEYMSLTLASLFDEDMDVLEEMGIFGSSEDDDDEADGEDGLSQQRTVNSDIDIEEIEDDLPETTTTTLTLFRPAQGALYRGTPWFESMIEDSRLGRIKRRKGGYSSRDGASSVEWEVVEFVDDTDEDMQGVVGLSGKRKR